MKKKGEARVKRLSVLGMMGSVVSMMSEAIGLGLGIACVAVFLAGPGSHEVAEGRSVSAAGWHVRNPPDKVARVDHGASACPGEEGQW